MPLLWVRLTAPAVIQPNMQFAIKCGFGTDKIQSVKLVQYWASGLINDEPMMFQIVGQCQDPIMGNVTTTKFPLLWNQVVGGTCRVELFTPMEIAGHGFMNGAAQFTMELSSSNPTLLPNFSEMHLCFKINYLEDPLYYPNKDIDWSLMQH